ncbi:MAG TPA: serine/threonine-protein kinase, partial [Kofleriaceae bacterium]|nr:serine/threonine-protein kinase [Kofleriaceae bacterium]
MIGTSAGNYRIVSEIGMGGMGAVYLAKHAMLEKTAAVKVLRPEMSRDSAAVTRFINEARAASTIKHPSIVEIYDFGSMADGSVYIIMELLQGESLAARMRRVGRMAPALAMLLARQIAGALEAAHSHQIIHRDLKPDNVFIVRDPEIDGGERIKLLDFGIAKLAPDLAASSQTHSGTILGTPSYMSPEQCRGAGKIDARADLYSLGCLLYKMLCKRPPFVADSEIDVMAQHLHCAPEPLRTLDASIPAPVERMVMGLLCKDPNDRPGSASQVIEDIDALGLMPLRKSSVQDVIELVAEESQGGSGHGAERDVSSGDTQAFAETQAGALRTPVDTAPPTSELRPGGEARPPVHLGGEARPPVPPGGEARPPVRPSAVTVSGRPQRSGDTVQTTLSFTASQVNLKAQPVSGGVPRTSRRRWLALAGGGLATIGALLLPRLLGATDEATDGAPPRSRRRRGCRRPPRR